MSALPQRDHASEDAFITQLSASDDPEALAELADAALAAGRPALAARLVGLLPDAWADALPDEQRKRLDRARRAATLVVRRGTDVTQAQIDDLIDAWEGARLGRVRGIVQRMRSRHADPGAPRPGSPRSRRGR
jgi:hypothetical protein